MTTTLHAQPYDTSASGFYFTSVEEYETRFEARLPVEEYEIQFIDGSDDDCVLASIVGLTQCTIERYFELLDEAITGDELLALEYLVKNVGYDLATALEHVYDVSIYHGKLSDWAYDEAKEHGLEGFALQYFDEEAYIRDCECGGDIVELAHNIHITNATSL